MKRLRYMRHLHQGDCDDEILQKELDIIAKTLRDNYTDIFYGPLYRTLRTVEAVCETLGIKCRVQRAKEIGSGPFIDSALSFLKEFDSKGKVYVSFVPYIESLKNLFSLLPENGYGLAVGHGPVIELTALCFGHKIKPLSFFEFVDFTQNESGKITVIKP